MTSAKNIRIEPIDSTTARRFIRRHHYSGKVAPNSQLHLGALWNGKLEGVMQFGPPLDRRKVIGLVADTPHEGMCELNRMAFTDALPRNSESRALSIACKLLRKHTPHIQWILTFADATQCGDGTIYRAAGFLLTSITTNRNLARLPDGTVIHKMTLESSPSQPRPELGGRTYYDITNGKYDWNQYITTTNAELLTGYQLRYIKPLHPDVIDRLTTPILPYSAITDAGAGMYRGQRRGPLDSEGTTPQVVEGGASPTPRLQHTAETP